MIPVPFEYETLKVIWWFLLGILLIGFAVTEGFDFGVMLLMPFIAKNDLDRRILINTIGPVWEGNQVWLVLGAGAIFAAFPLLYVAAFSGFYLAMLLLLLGLVLRPVAIKFRSKSDKIWWRNLWDSCLFASAVSTALVIGIALGNVIQGVPFQYDSDLRLFYSGSFISLFNVYAIGVGLLVVGYFSMHGAAYLQLKTTGYLNQQALRIGRFAAMLTLILYLILGCALYGLDGYHLLSDHLGNMPSNPLFKSVLKTHGFWFQHFREEPLRIIPIFISIACLLSYIVCSKLTYRRSLFLSSMGSGAAMLFGFGVMLFPFLLPSSSNPSMGLTIWDAASSKLTLFVMLVMALIFVPVILTYTSWVYYVLRGQVTSETVRDELNAY